MVLSKSDFEKILKKVKKEPCLIQDIAKEINKSWVTAERYIEKIEKEKGLIKIKTFRAGTQGAIKLAYWNYSSSIGHDEFKDWMLNVIKSNSDKKFFDPLEIYQRANKKGSKVITDFYDEKLITSKQNLTSFLKQTKEELILFSGNLSFINMTENGIKMIHVLEDLLKRKVELKILCRVDFASIYNINKMEKLIKKYPNQIEIRHCFQPIRGFIRDNEVLRLKDEKLRETYKFKEMKQNMIILYNIEDKEWVEWFRDVFWYLYRKSLDYDERMKVFQEMLK
ncbi:hypothetical protein KY334_01330 [Candidatus Woesearchaeota archaeon]|nr:hypothetical protein [Candidatus Woesearchaeota archaeon]